MPIMPINWIEYDNPNTLEEVMGKEKFCSNQNKYKSENVPAWKNKRPNNFDPRKKKNKFNKNTGNNYRGYLSFPNFFIGSQWPNHIFHIHESLSN